MCPHRGPPRLIESIHQLRQCIKQRVYIIFNALFHLIYDLHNLPKYRSGYNSIRSLIPHITQALKWPRLSKMLLGWE